MRKFDVFVNLLRKEINQDVVAVYEFGSGKGEDNPKISDIDLFVIAKDKDSIPVLFHKVRNIEKEIYHIEHSALTDMIEEETFASNDFTGIHLIVIAKDELDEKYRLKSRRLKFITATLVSKDILFYHLKHEGKLLFGEDIISKIEYSRLTLKDRFSVFVPIFVILCSIPLFIGNSKQFKIWCLKVVKYNSELITTYLNVRDNTKLRNTDVFPNNRLINNLIRYRYHISQFKENPFILYMKVWLFVINNLPFLWNENKFS